MATADAGRTEPPADRPGQADQGQLRRAGSGLGENFTDSAQSVLELLTRVGADAWELADREEREERGDGPSYWDPSRTVTIYTFKNPVPG
jgi:hypothetical protein